MTQVCNLFARNYNGMNIYGLLNCDDGLSFHRYKYVLNHYDRVLVLGKQITLFSVFNFCICDQDRYGHVFYLVMSLSAFFYLYVNAHELLLITYEINNYDLHQSDRVYDDH